MLPAEYRWSNGSVYVGPFVDNHMEGRGSFVTAGGVQYIGVILESGIYEFGISEFGIFEFGISEFGDSWSTIHWCDIGYIFLTKPTVY